MKLKINRLIVLEDLYLTQTYTGLMGKFFRNFYLLLSLLRLKILLLFIRNDKKTLILCSDLLYPYINNDFPKKNYSSLIENIDFSSYRLESIKLTNSLLKFLDKYPVICCHGVNPFQLWWSQTAIYLSYQYLPYKKVMMDLITKYKIKEILVAGKSKEGLIAIEVAEKLKLKIKKYYFANFTRINSFMLGFLFKRQIKERTKNFIKNSSQKNVKNYQEYKKSYVLSADFFRHLKTLAPIYQKFSQKGKRVFFLADNQEIKKTLIKIYKISKDFILLPGFIETQESLRDLKTQKKICSGAWKDFKNSFLEDKNFNAFCVLENYFKNVILHILPLNYLYLKAAGNLFENLQPAGVICINDNRIMENALLEMAAKYKTKKIISHPSMFLSTEKISRLRADYFLAVGEHIKKELLQVGYPEKKIIINGDPQLDFLANKDFYDKKKIYQKINLSLNKKIVLLISDRINPMLSLEDKKDQFQKVAAACQDFKDVQLLVKPHPTEDKSVLKTDLENWGIDNVLVTDNRKIELFELLAISRTVIIAWSMVGFEAMLFKVPVIVANFQHKNYDFQIPYVKGGGAVQIETIADLQKKIKLFLIENSLKNMQIKKGLSFCSKYYRLPLGGAANRVCELMIKNNAYGVY